jgi:uncharacterized protein
MTIEYRYQRGDKPGLEEGKLHGRAATFNSPTIIGGEKYGFRESIAPGAFKKSIKDGDVVLLDQHDTAKPLARTSAGTLTLRESSKGLEFEANPSDTTYGRDAVETARAKNYGGMSFGFEVIRDSWKRGDNGAPDERTLHEVRLHEISAVTFPAYGDTVLSARDQYQAALESRERALGPVDEDEDRGGDAPGNGKKPYGNVTYADSKNGKYPIDSKAHAKAAWSYINMPKNAAKYPLNGVSLASVKARIKAACKKFGVDVSDKNSADLVYDVRAVLEMQKAEILTVEEAFEMLRDMVQDDPDPYEDSFYEREDDSDAEEAEDDRDAKDGDPGTGRKCPMCKGKKNVPNDDGDMKTCPKCKGKGTVAKREDDEDSDDAEDGDRSGEPDASTRTDEDRKDALRRLKAKALLNSRDNYKGPDTDNPEGEQH